MLHIYTTLHTHVNILQHTWTSFVFPLWLSRMSSVCIFSPLTAQSAHGPDPIQFQPKASSVPSPPWPVRSCALLIGHRPLQQAQPRALSPRLSIRPFGVLGRFDPGGEGGLLLWLTVQQVLQVVQGQKVIVAFQKLLHKLEGEKKDLIQSSGNVRGRIIQSAIHFISLSCSPALPSAPFFYISHPLWILLNILFSSFSIVSATSPPPLLLPLPTCTASGGGCRARASEISRGVRRSRAAQSSTGHSMAAESTDRKEQLELETH